MCECLKFVRYSRSRYLVAHPWSDLAILHWLHIGCGVSILFPECDDLVPKISLGLVINSTGIVAKPTLSVNQSFFKTDISSLVTSTPT